MEINASLVNKANAIVKTVIEPELIKENVNKLAQKAAKQMKVDGFRPGKVPLNVVLKRYGKDLENDAKQEIFKNIIDESLKIIGKKPEDVIGEPIFSKYDEKDGKIDIEIELSLKPEVDVKGYEEALPAFTTPKVTKKEVDAKIQEYLKMIAPIEKIEKEALEKGDYAKFDFEGFLDGVPFEGGKAENYVLEIGSNQFIPGFEDGMVGMKVLEEKDIKVKFPEEYNAAHLAGKEVLFKVKLHEIQAKKPAKEINEEELKKVLPSETAPTKEKFENMMKDEIKNEKFESLLLDELKPKFIDAIIEKVNFDLPKAIVEEEISMRFSKQWQDFTAEEVKTFREDKDALTKKREEFRPEAEKSVKITFIVDALAKEKGIKVNDQEVIQAIYFEAYRYGIDPKKHLEEYKNNGMIPAIKMSIIEEKLFRDLFSQKDAKEENKKVEEGK